MGYQPPKPVLPLDLREWIADLSLHRLDPRFAEELGIEPRQPPPGYALVLPKAPPGGTGESRPPPPSPSASNPGRRIR